MTLLLARFPLPGAVVTRHSEEVGLRAQETFWRAGRRVLDSILLPETCGPGRYGTLFGVYDVCTGM
jgi:hypothetical protein